MEQPTRVFKTLGCLAVAMTAAAAWLGCIDPSAPLVPELQSYEEVQREAHALVVDAVRIHKGKWQDVEIVAGPGRLSSGTLLAARFENGDYHFRIDRRGRASRTGRWEHQQPPNRQDGTVIIAVAQTPHLDGMSRAQWHCLRALLAALRESTNSPDEASGSDNISRVSDDQPLRVRVHSDWARVYDLEPGTVVEIPTPVDSVG